MALVSNVQFRVATSPVEPLPLDGRANLTCIRALESSKPLIRDVYNIFRARGVEPLDVGIVARYCPGELDLAALENTGRRS